MDKDNSLRITFNTAAEDYNAVRPGYPEELFADVVAFSAIEEDGQALEIGCGTGQATHPFARRGYNILCLDIGPDLLAMAAENLRTYPNVHFENISFEEWPLRESSFDLVYAATSFHWVPREIGYPKAAQALKPGGALAVFSNTHPRPFTDFFVEVQPIYDRCLPELADRRDVAALVSKVDAEIEWIRSTGLFSIVESRNYFWTRSYSTAEYLRLLNTYSDHLAIAEDRRRGLYQSIADLIDSRYGGRIEKPYLTELFLAKKPGF